MSLLEDVMILNCCSHAVTMRRTECQRQNRKTKRIWVIDDVITQLNLPTLKLSKLRLEQRGG